MLLVLDLVSATSCLCRTTIFRIEVYFGEIARAMQVSTGVSLKIALFLGVLATVCVSMDYTITTGMYRRTGYNTNFFSLNVTALGACQTLHNNIADKDFIQCRGVGHDDVLDIIPYQQFVQVQYFYISSRSLSSNLSCSTLAGDAKFTVLTTTVDSFSEGVENQDGTYMGGMVAAMCDKYTNAVGKSAANSANAERSLSGLRRS